MAETDDGALIEGLAGKLEAFASGLSPEEREVLAAALVPGGAEDDGEDEVEGFSFGMSLAPRSVAPIRLADAVRGAALRPGGPAGFGNSLDLRAVNPQPLPPKS